MRNKLINQSLKNGGVTEFELRERGKIRPVTSISVEDRIVRHVLCDDILSPRIRNKILYDNG